jgi:FkbM family methyltransferase
MNKILRRIASSRIGCRIAVMCVNCFLQFSGKAHRLYGLPASLVFGGNFEGFTVYDRFDFSFSKSEILHGPYAHHDIPSELWYRSYKPSQGDVIVDVGAHVGTDTLFFSRSVGPTGRVLSIESHPRICHLLELNVLANKVRNVEVINCAVSDTDGHVTVNLDDISVGSTVFDGAESVQCKSLDSILSGTSQIDFLKMNIEGYERLALQGGRQVLSRTRHVVIACHDFLDIDGDARFYSTLNETKEILEELGFCVQKQEDRDRPWVACHLHGVNAKLVRP